MPKKVVEYKKPRKINVVSVSLVILIGLSIYMGIQMVSISMDRSEAHRALQETSSKFFRNQSTYLRNPESRKKLIGFMEGELARAGVGSPEDLWIDVDGKEVFLGVKFKREIHWPFELLEPIPREIVAEHAIVVR